MSDSYPDPAPEKIELAPEGSAERIFQDLYVEFVATLMNIEAQFGPAVATKLATGLVATALAFAADRAEGDQERGAVADSIRLLADSVLLRRPAGHA